MPELTRAAAATGAPVVHLVATSEDVRAATEAALEDLHVVGPKEAATWWPASRMRAPSFWAATTLAEVNWCLTMLGSPREIHCHLRDSSAGHRARWERIFLHLEHEGRYVLPRAAFPDDASFRALAAEAARNLASLLAGSDAEMPSGVWRSLGGLEITEAALVLVKRSTHMIVHRDKELLRVFGSRLRRSAVREVAALEARTHEVTAELHHHGNKLEHQGFEPIWEVPAQHLRAYEGDVRMVGRCLVTVENSVIPESFRFHHEATLRNPLLHRVGHEFAEVPLDTNFNAIRLEGSFYHVDCSNPGHFGHLTTEVLSKLWGWDAARKDDPSTRLLFRIRRPGERHPELELRLFEAFGVSRDDAVWVGEPAYVDRLYAASPQWHQHFPHFVDPRIEDTWARLRESFVDTSARTPERIFVSRLPATSNNRVCRNTREVEVVFESYGFTTIYPETMTLEEQATTFAGARVVAGLAGSALFNLLYSQHVQQLVVLTHESYTARNEYMFAGVKGFRVDYVWNRADVQHPKGGWSEEAYFSGWEADVEHLRATLRKIL